MSSTRNFLLLMFLRMRLDCSINTIIIRLDGERKGDLK